MTVSVWTSPDPATLYRRPADGAFVSLPTVGRVINGKTRVRGPFSGRDKAMEACE